MPFSVLLLFGSGCAARRTAAPAAVAATPPEIRALWVDAFHAGIRSPQEAEQLVADAKRANFNTLVVQVRRRGDALYTKSFEPPLDDPAYDPAFDALAHILEVGHRNGLEVHAWINAMPLWRELPPPRDPRHVFNLHGPSQTGDNNWLTLAPDGKDRFPVGYFLDPGHPAAASHVVEVYLNIVRHYPVDGIHFDYIRYPETEERLPRGSGVGYNTVALRRFRAVTGRTDTPAPDDDEWSAWRRLQVTNLVRRVSIEARAINPKIKISAATIAWGQPPTNEKNFLDAAPGQRIFQDWHSWLKDGLLDIAFPMNYARESDARVRGWFDGWIAWEKKHKHGGQLVIGLGAYLNPPRSTLAQVTRARTAEGDRRADGASFFSYYATMVRPAGSPPPAGELVQEPAFAFLTAGVAAEVGQPSASPVFDTIAAIPRSERIESPSTGWVAGVIHDSNGQPRDGAQVRIRRTGSWFARSRTATTDGSGYFGFALVKPGRYRVRAETEKGERGQRLEARVDVQPGRVARVEFASPTK